KPAGQHPAEHPDERAFPARHVQRRLTEQQQGERDIVRGRGEQRGAPVEHGHPVTVGEQAARMQVTVADDGPARGGRATGHPPGARTNGVGKPAAATALCTIVTLRAAAGSGIRRATSSDGQPAGGSASENDRSSAQNPPRSGSGRRSYSRRGTPAALSSTSRS